VNPNIVDVYASLKTKTPQNKQKKTTENQTNTKYQIFS